LLYNLSLWGKYW